MRIFEKLLPEDEYFTTTSEKTTIVLHHTAGSHRPDWVISSWDKDKSKGGKPLKVATHYVIGGKSREGDEKWDGVIYQAMPLENWAHHLGTKNSNNTQLNKQSIGIEICNYGPLTRTTDGEYFTYVNSKIEEKDVVDLGKNFRGYRYYQKYTDKQLSSLAFLLTKLSKEFNIGLCWGLNEVFEKKKRNVENMEVLDIQQFLNSKGYTGIDGKRLEEDGLNGRNTKYALRTYMDVKRGDWNAFEYQERANEGHGGVWSHTNYRKDKTDVYPYDGLIEMLKSF
jgi:hypothetical protein